MAYTWYFPTSFTDVASNYINEALAYDNNVSTYSYGSVFPAYPSMSSYLQFNIAARLVNAIRSMHYNATPYTAHFEYDVYYDGGWHNIFDAPWGAYHQIYRYIYMPDIKEVSAVRYRCGHLEGSYSCFNYEIQFGYEPADLPPSPKPVAGGIGMGARFQPLRGPAVPILR
jgi:hypothetical protein